MQESLHIYNYIDAADLPIRLEEEKTTPELFTVYQCPAYGTHEIELPLDNTSVNETEGSNSVPNDSDPLPNEVCPQPCSDDTKVKDDYDHLDSIHDVSDSSSDELYQTVDLSNMQFR